MLQGVDGLREGDNTDKKDDAVEWNGLEDRLHSSAPEESSGAMSEPGHSRWSRPDGSLSASSEKPATALEPTTRSSANIFKSWWDALAYWWWWHGDLVVVVLSLAVLLGGIAAVIYAYAIGAKTVFWLILGGLAVFVLVAGVILDRLL